MRKALRRLGFLALFLLLVAVLLAATQNLWLRWMGDYLVQAGPPCKADIIVVLAGDWWGNRILKAGELQRAGWAPKVLMSGAGSIYGNTESDLAIQFAIKAGYSPDAFFGLPSPARSTEEEAKFIVAEMRRRGVHKYMLVTSNYHTHRSAEIYREAAPDLPFCTVASPDPDFSPDTWWHTREGRKTAFFEWCKTIAHILHV